MTTLAIGNIGKRREAGAGGYAGNAHATGCCDTQAKPRSHDTSRIAWAKLMARVGEEFPLECPNCGGDIRLIAFITEPAEGVQKFLTSVGAERIENLLSREEADVMYRKLELDSVPAVFVWRPDGSLAHRFDDDDAKRRLGRPFTYTDVDVEVRSCLPK